MSLALLAAVVSCAENPRLEIQTFDQEAVVVQFNMGPFIKEVDLDNAMNSYCGSLKPKIIREERKQLPGQYRFQKKIEFKCVAQ
ncbi:MAG: hypothetical protein OEW15_00490 [Nitrospirota bacterium]|nr:hypothetical protein [Nitrospirota bacterium]